MKGRLVKIKGGLGKDEGALCKDKGGLVKHEEPTGSIYKCFWSAEWEN
jgi:hypothetical protein